MLTGIDFETKDPLLKKYGSGAVFKYHYEEIDFKILGCGIKTEKEEVYLDFINDSQAKIKLNKYMQEASVLIMHNAAYDLGCIKYIYKECRDIEKHLPEIHDTLLMAKLIFQTKLGGYDLETLALKYKCESLKDSDMLHEYAWNSGLYQEQHKIKTKRNCHKRPSKSILENFCKTNLDLFPSEIVGEYCLFDVKATWELYNKLLAETYYDLSKLSKIIKICLKSKFKGVRLDLKVTDKLSKQWKELAKECKHKLLNALKEEDRDININSVAQVGPALENIGFKIPKTILGNYSITKDWLEELEGNEILDSLRIYRKAYKAEKDFIQKIIQYQEVIPEKYRQKDIGIMFPTLKPLGATLTGRFSSGGGTGSLELNVLAISGRDEHFGMPIRELFLPYSKDEKIVCADFSNQEPRLQVHYANLLKCKGIEKIVEAWNNEPKMKYHNKVAELTQLAYDVAKMLTLGLSYGMGAYKMSIRLNIPIEKAKMIIKQYHVLMPFMSQLQEACAQSIKKNGYIKTIGGRRLNLDKPYEYMGKMKTNEYKGMSKLVQGSGLDQLWEAMISIYDRGLDFMLCVHDEIIISSKEPEKDKVTLVDCMENAYTLCVPVIAEVGIGNNWLEAKP